MKRFADWWQERNTLPVGCGVAVLVLAALGVGLLIFIGVNVALNGPQILLPKETTYELKGTVELVSFEQSKFGDVYETTIWIDSKRYILDGYYALRSGDHVDLVIKSTQGTDTVIEVR